MGVKQTAKPLLINDLKSIIKVIDKENNPKRLQNKALLLIGFSVI